MAKRYYVAYGSNLNIEQMRRRCPSAKVAGTGEIRDYRLMFKGSRSGAYLTIEPETGCSVPVGVWEVTAEDERALDAYEGFPRFYYKQEMQIPVRSLGGRTWVRTVFVYIMHEDRPFGMPSDTYVSTCLDGYRAFGFDDHRLTEALAYTAKEVTENENK